MKLRNPLIWVAGGDPAVLALCPGQARRTATYGGSIVFTGVIAGVAATFATRSWLHVEGWPSIVVGIVWGLGILNLDRMLFMALARQSAWWRTLLLAVPRVVLAILVGRVIAEPVVLQLFKDEVTQQAVADRNAGTAASQKALTGQYASITALTARRARLRRALDAESSDDVVEADPAYHALGKKIATAQRKVDDLQEAASCELDGRCGSKHRGEGPSYARKAALARAAQAELGKLQQQASTMRARLVTAAQQNRVQRRRTAAADLVKVEQDLAVQTRRRDRASADVAKAAAAPIGFLGRVKALEALERRESVVSARRHLFELFIIAIDCLPVLIKSLMLLGAPSPYEEIEEEIRLRQLNGTRTETDAYEAAGRVEAAMIVDDAEVRRELTRDATRDVHARVLEVQREAALTYVERWREAILEQTDDWVEEHLRAQAPGSTRRAADYATDWDGDDAGASGGRFQR